MAKNSATRQKELRKRKKHLGYKQINIFIDRKSTERLERLMEEIDDSIVGTISSALKAAEYIHFNLELPDIVTKYSPEDSEVHQKKRQKQRKARKKKKEPVRMIRI
jgi:hypothetical protein